MRPTGGRADRGTRGRECGAASLEFAIVVVVLLALVFGVIEFGRAVWLQQAVNASSREGARYGIGNHTISSTPQYLDCAGIRAAARNRVPDVSLEDADIAITYRHGDGTTSTCGSSPAPTIFDGDRIVVTISTELDVDLPLVPLGSMTLRAEDQRTVFTGVSP